VIRSAKDDTNDTVILVVTAANGSAIKDAAIDVTILEAKPPYLVSVTVEDKDNSHAISTGDVVTLLFSEPISEVNRKKALVDIFGINHPYGENAILVWTDEQTAVITVGTNSTLKFGDILTPNVTDARGNPYQDNGHTKWNNIIESEIDMIASNLTDAVIKNHNPSLDEVTTALSLPTEFEGATIVWSANTVDGATVNSDGTVVRSGNDDIDDAVTLTATITHNGDTKTKTFQVTIKESKVPTISEVTLQDIDTDGQPSLGDEIVLTFSESIESLATLTIAGQTIDVSAGTWTDNQTKLTVTLPNLLTTADTVTVTILKDQNNNENSMQTIALSLDTVTKARAKVNAGIATIGDYTTAGITGLVAVDISKINPLVTESKTMKGTNLSANEVQQLVTNYKKIIPYTLSNKFTIGNTYGLTHEAGNIGNNTRIYNVYQPGKEAYFVNWTDINGNEITTLTIEDVPVLAHLNYKVVDLEKPYLSVAMVDSVIKTGSTPPIINITRTGGTYSIATP